MQETLVGYLIWDYPVCHWPNKTVLQLLTLCSTAWEPELLRPQAAITEAFCNPEAVLYNKRSHHSEKPTYCNYSLFFAHIISYKNRMQQMRYMLLLLLSHFSHVRLCATPWTAPYQAPPSMGFSRQKYWSGVPLPSPDEVYR